MTVFTPVRATRNNKVRYFIIESAESRTLRHLFIFLTEILTANRANSNYEKYRGSVETAPFQAQFSDQNFDCE